MLTSMLFILSATVSVAPKPTDENLLASLKPWEQFGGNHESFRLDQGVLSFESHGNEPVALLTQKDYENFDCTFEFKCDGWVENGFYLHVPRNGAFRAGQEIEIESHLGGTTPYSMGAIFRVAPPQTAWTKKEGWNTCHIHMEWPRLTVTMNDVLLQDIDLAAHESLRYTLRRGAVGFQHNGWNFSVRNLHIIELPDTEQGISLCNGKDLEGWKVADGNADWQVKDGAITVCKGSGYLVHQGVFQDFELRLLVRTVPTANGGVFFRASDTDIKDRGQEIQVFDFVGATMCTGSVYGIARADDLGITPQKWELLQIFARGNRVITYINGIKGAETDAVTCIRPGHIMLQAHHDGMTLEYKDMVLVSQDVSVHPESKK